MTGRYDPKVRTAAGNRARLRSAAGGHGWFDDAGRARFAERLAALACADGRHRTETDAETGDEVCRWCKEVIV